MAGEGEAAAAREVPTEADIQLIRRILPHRYPFLLVDRVVEVEANRAATGIKAVTANEPHFQGHFPARPIMPGVAIVEAMAQTAGVLVGLSQGLIDTGALIYFMSIEKARFRRMVVPGDVLRMRVEVIRPGTKILKFNGRATVEGELAAEADFTAMIAREGA